VVGEQTATALDFSRGVPVARWGDCPMTGTDGGPPTRTLPAGGRRGLELYEPLAHVVPDIGIVITTPVSIPVKLASEASRQANMHSNWDRTITRPGQPVFCGITGRWRECGTAHSW